MLIKFPSWAVTFAFPVYLSALEYVTIELYTGFIFGDSTWRIQLGKISTHIGHKDTEMNGGYLKIN